VPRPRHRKGQSRKPTYLLVWLPLPRSNPSVTAVVRGALRFEQLANAKLRSRETVPPRGRAAVAGDTVCWVAGTQQTADPSKQKSAETLSRMSLLSKRSVLGRSWWRLIAAVNSPLLRPEQLLTSASTAVSSRTRTRRARRHSARDSKLEREGESGDAAPRPVRLWDRNLSGSLPCGSYAAPERLPIRIIYQPRHAYGNGRILHSPSGFSSDS